MSLIGWFPYFTIASKNTQGSFNSIFTFMLEIDEITMPMGTSFKSNDNFKKISIYAPQNLKLFRERRDNLEASQEPNNK